MGRVLVNEIDYGENYTFQSAYASPGDKTTGGFTETKPVAVKKVSKISRVPRLTFSLAAYTKLLYIRDLGSTEVGFMAICRDPELPTYIDDIQMIKQTCSTTTVEFDDLSFADYVEDCVDAGLQPFQCGRIWLHTHPGNSPSPSSTDEDTFARCFSDCDWSIMFIIAQDGSTYARIQFGVGPRGYIEMEVEVDYHSAYEASDHSAWKAEYEEHLNVTSYGKAMPISEYRQMQAANTNRVWYPGSTSGNAGATHATTPAYSPTTTTVSTGATQPLEIPKDDNDLLATARALGAPTTVLTAIHKDKIGLLIQMVAARTMLRKDYDEAMSQAEAAWENATACDRDVEKAEYDAYIATYTNQTQAAEDLKFQLARYENEIRRLSNQSGGIEDFEKQLERSLKQLEERQESLEHDTTTGTSDTTVVVTTPGVSDVPVVDTAGGAEAGPVLAAAGDHSSG